MGKVAIIYLHGQGSYKENSHEELINNIKDNIDFNVGLIKVFPVYYYSRIQENQNELIKRMDITRPKVVAKIRDKIVSSFGDPSTIYHNKEEYDFVMQKIKEQFVLAQEYLGSSGHMVAMAHSLGTSLISNYLWDMQKAGIKYDKLKLLVTTGSPSPVFISGKNIEDITPIDRPSPNFKWLNFWNAKDALSFRLQRVNNSYHRLVKDIRCKKGFWFFAHSSYKSDKRVYKLLAKEIQYLLDD